MACVPLRASAARLLATSAAAGSAPARATAAATAAEAFRALEHRNWEKAVSAYNKGFGRLTRQCIPEVLSAVGCGPGVRLLDVATGPGFAAEAAARAGASATGLDFSARMLELARQRFSEAGLHADFVEADAGALPFEGSSFDAVVCNFGVLHLPVPEDFFAEAARVLKPGGRLAFTVWAPPTATEVFELLTRVVKEVGNPNVELPEGPPFFRFADPGEAARAMAEAGLDAATTTQVPMQWEMQDPDELFVTMRDGTGRTAALLAGQTPEQSKAIEQALREGAEAKRQGTGGTITFSMPCMLTVAKKPAGKL